MRPAGQHIEQPESPFGPFEPHHRGPQRRRKTQRAVQIGREEKTEEAEGS